MWNSAETLSIRNDVDGMEQHYLNLFDSADEISLTHCDPFAVEEEDGAGGAGRTCRLRGFGPTRVLLVRQEILFSCATPARCANPALQTA